MVNLKNTLKTGLAAFALALLSGTEAKAEKINFDNGSAGGSSGIVNSIQDLRGIPGLGDNGVPISSPTLMASEFEEFKLGLGAPEGICKLAQLKLNQEARLINEVGIGALYGRFMRRLPGGRMALIDEVGVKLSVDIGQDTLQIPEIGLDGVGFGVMLSGGIEGKSSVMRPLGSMNYCKELRTMVKYYDVKTVLPLKAGRIKAMEKGEIWKLPLTFKYGFGASVSSVVNEVVTVTIGGGIGKAMTPSVSLYRMGENELRLRIRIDNVLVKNVGGSLKSVSVPAGEMGLGQASNAITSVTNSALAGLINKYIAFQLGYQYTRAKGKKLLLEFILDPNDAEQMDGLVKLLGGDFGIVKKLMALGVNFRNFSLAESDEGVMPEMAAQAAAALNTAPSYAGSSNYSETSHNMSLTVPIIYSRDTSWSTRQNRYQSLDGRGGTLHVQQSSKKYASATLLGLGKHGYQKNAFALNREDADGKVTRPAFVYQQYEGFRNYSDRSARGMLEGVNSVLKNVGAQVNGANSGAMAPADLIFPPMPKEPDAFRDVTDAPLTKSYKAVFMSFTLAISEGGVQEILAAPAKAIVKAYLNMMRETYADIIDKVAELFAVDGKGKVVYDQRAAEKALDVSAFDTPENGGNPLSTVQYLAYTATRVIADIADIRNAGGWKEQSKKLAEVAAGKGHSGLAYTEFLGTVVQLADPLGISADLYVQTSKNLADEQDYDGNLHFFSSQDQNFDRTIADVVSARQRFAAPTDITD